MEENMTTESARISFPLPSLGAARNLVFTIYSKGQLLSKATGGNFYVSERLLEELAQSESATEFYSLINSAGEEGLCGLAFEDEAVVFTGFPDVSDPGMIKANASLATAIYKYCTGNHRVQPRRMDCENEKFSFRVWLVRLRLMGPGFKDDRALFYSHLTGHTAFRTPQAEERWKARRQARKATLR